MNKTALVIFSTFFSLILFAIEPDSCFFLEAHQTLLKIEPLENGNYQATFYSPESDYITPFEFKLISRARGILENEDVFELVDNDQVQMRFNGKRSNWLDVYSETGAVSYLQLESTYARVPCPSSQSSK